MAEPLKVIVLDDDPTGSQTVHSCPLLLRWDAASLAQGLAHPSPLLFLLANTRALDPAAAAERVREICRALKPALAAAVAAGVIERWLIVSRGDSTLRGHFPLEPQVIAEELGPFAATLLVPAFLPGGRSTAAGIHRLHGEPVHTTEFARDRLFGFSTSHLPAWVAEKTAGRIPAAAVQAISLAELDGAPQPLAARLAALVGPEPLGTVVAVDAEQPQQLAVLGEAVRAALSGGQRLLFQSAASLINGLVPLPPQPLDAAGLAGLRRRDGSGRPLPALVLVGSHVPLADAQLEVLLRDPACCGVEIAVPRLARLLEGPLPELLLASLEQAWLEQLRAALAAGRTPVLFSSRGEVSCRSAAERRQLGLALAALMARLAAALAPELGLIISKGGITTHTLLADGLQLPWAELQGQLFAGLSLVLTPDQAPVPRLPVVTFPGNLGDAGSLHQAWRLLTQP